MYFTCNNKFHVHKESSWTMTSITSRCIYIRCMHETWLNMRLFNVQDMSRWNKKRLNRTIKERNYNIQLNSHTSDSTNHFYRLTLLNKSLLIILGLGENINDFPCCDFFVVSLLFSLSKCEKSERKDSK